MINAAPLRVQSEYVSQFGYFRMFLLAIYWVALLLSSPGHRSNAGVACFIVLIGLNLGINAWLFGRALADGARVFNTLQAPRMLWREWLRVALNGIGIQWIVAIVGGTVAVLVSRTGWTWSAAACIVSAFILLGTIASLSQYGVCHWAWPWCITLAFLILAVLLGWDGLNQFMQASMLWQLPIAVGVPVLIAGLAWHWRNDPPPGVGERGRMQFNPLRRAMNYLKRYAPLAEAKQRSAQTKTSIRTQVYVNTIMPIYLFILYGDMLQGHWGGRVGLLYIGMLAFLVLFTSRLAVCKDLHWRRVLSPNGFPRGRLGWHIMLSTLTMTAMLVAVAIAALGLLLLVFKWCGIALLPTLPKLLEIASRHLVIPLELVLVICLGVVLRAVRRQLLTYLTAIVTLSVVGLVAVWYFDTTVMFDLFEIGPAYVGCLLLAIGITIWIANRLWTTQRLLPFIVAGAVSNDDTTMGGRWFTWPGRGI
jgi:hypothetical protein